MKHKKAIIDDGFNPELVEGAHFAGMFDFPCIDAPKEIITPKGLTPWTRRAKAPTDCELLEFFEQDVKFSEILEEPETFVDEISRFPIFTPPDCSAYRNAPLAVQIGNIYKSRAIGSFYQRHGANVYPLIRWGDERTYTTCLFTERIAFSAVERNSPVVVSSYGCYKSADDKFHFNAGLLAMLDELEPRLVILHGPLDEELVKRVHERTHLVQYPDWVTRMKGRG